MENQNRNYHRKRKFSGGAKPETEPELELNLEKYLEKFDFEKKRKNIGRLRVDIAPNSETSGLDLL